MNGTERTERFLKHILPHDGWYALAIFRGRTVEHYWDLSIDKLAARAFEADRQGLTVYHACASYRERGSRKQSNAKAVRAFYLDVDAGKVNAAYADAREAYQACERFRGEMALPQPLYVASGTGVHAYWTLVSDLAPLEWQRYAQALKAACHTHRFHADPARTADIASILRPAGTHNRKDVSHLVAHGPLVGPYELTQFERLLKYEQPVRLPPREGSHRKLTNRIADVFEHVPKYARDIARQCAQLGKLRDTGGNIVEPLWYAALGVIAYCDDAEVVGHEWSNRHPKYTYAETAGRLARVRELSGATTCARFHALDPETCEACPFWEKINSPINLGKAQETPQQINGVTLPHGFVQEAHGLVYKTNNKKGEPADILISRFAIHLDNVQTGEITGDVNLCFKHCLPHDGNRDITVPYRNVFDNTLLSAVASRGVTIHEPSYFLHFVRESTDLYQQRAKMTTCYEQFGWKNGDNAFLYGRQLYTAAGQTPVLGSKEINLRSEKWIGPTPKGDLFAWCRAAERLFKAGAEPHSIMLLASIGTPLMHFQDATEGGAVIHEFSPETATGKSHALIAALSVWGQRDGLALVNADTNVTKLLSLGAMGNLPVVHDELLMKDPEVIKEFIVNFTNGRDKMRGTSGGEIKRNLSTWQTILFSASNDSLVDTLSLKDRRDPMAWRIIEFNVVKDRSLNHIDTEKDKRILLENAGHVGHVFLQWLLQPENLAFTKQTLAEVTKDIWLKTKLPADARFWVRTMGAVAVAGIIIRKLKLIDFSIDRLMNWWVAQIQHITEIQQQLDQPISANILGEFFNAHQENIIGFMKGFVFGEQQYPQRKPTRNLCIRYEEVPRRAYISRAALRHWLKKQGESYTSTIDQLEKLGIVTDKQIRRTLSAGWNELPGAQIYCVEVDMRHPAIADSIPHLVVDNVVPFNSPKKSGEEGDAAPRPGSIL